MLPREIEALKGMTVALEFRFDQDHRQWQAEMVIAHTKVVFVLHRYPKKRHWSVPREGKTHFECEILDFRAHDPKAAFCLGLVRVVGPAQ